MKVTTLLLTALAAVACSADSETSYVSIYYIPFGVETYIPVTRDNIEESAHRYGRIDSASRLSKKISEVLMAVREGSFDSEKVRAKVVYPDQITIYVDNSGGVLSSETGEGRIDQKRFGRLAELLEKATGPVDG